MALQYSTPLFKCHLLGAIMPEEVHRLAVLIVILVYILLPDHQALRVQSCSTVFLQTLTVSIL